MYEYANRLARKGYEVHLTFPVKTQYMEYRLPYWVRRALSVAEGFRTNRWFGFDKSITMSYVPEVKERYVRDADIIIATWWATVLEMGKLSLAKGRKINLIQGFENWTGHEDLLLASYNMPDTTNVVVASFLKDIVEEHTNNPVFVIENGIDSDIYKIATPIAERNPASVAMNYSIQKIKGSAYGLEALQLVKKRIPELKVELFGVCPCPDGLPEWINFYRAPDNLSAIYNRNAIFISNSFTEGFGLVSVESMFCGCALVCTDIQGHKEYAFDNETALLVEVKNAAQMAGKICYLISNNEERIAMAQRGNSFARRFDWCNAIERMEKVIKGLIEKGTE